MQSQERQGAGLRWRWLKWLLLAVMVTLLAYWARHDEIDDAFIYARYIHNALSGYGLVFNPGEHVNALTSPFFTYLLLAGSWLLGGKILLATAILCGVFLFLAVLLAERLVPFAGFLVASTSYFYTLIGMETALFLFMLMLVLTLFIKRKDSWLPIVSILLILTRFEGAALVALVAVAMLRERRFPRWISYLPAAGVVLLYGLLNRHWYGRFLPNSATSKIGQGMSGFWGPWPTSFLRFSYQLKHDFLPMIYIVPLVCLGAGYAIWRYRRNRADQLIVGFCVILFGFYLLFNLPGYRWYFAPFIFFAMVLACQAIPARRGARVVAALVIACVLGTSAVMLYRLPYDLHSGYLGLGAWFMQHTGPSTRIESAETGTIGFYAPDRYIIDLIGLTTPKNADHIAHGDATSWLAEDRPDYIVLHDGTQPWEKVAKESPDYVPIGIRFGSAYVVERKDLLGRP